MANELMSFDFQGNGVRVVMQNGEPWWIAKDVCDVLGHTNPSMAIDRLDEDERAKFSLGRQGETNIVNEPGLYALILGSRKPEAKVFKRWITHDVIPSIRKNGMYVTDSLLDDPEHLLLVTQRLVEERKARIAAEALLEEQKPLVTFAETCLDSKDSILVRELAKVANKNGINIGQNRLYKLLREWGLILTDSTEPSQRAMDAEYFEVVQRPIDTPYGKHLVPTTRVTPRGQVHIIEKLKAQQTKHPKD
jgi:anti-repressor protein